MERPVLFGVRGVFLLMYDALQLTFRWHVGPIAYLTLSIDHTNCCYCCQNMKHKAYWLLIVVVLAFASSCKKEVKPCHDTVTIYNGSPDTILLGIRHGGTENNLCHLENPATIPPNSGWSDKVYNSCWENQFGASDQFMPEFYLVQNGGLNDQSNEYFCDSLGQYNTILQHNVLSLADLQAIDFVIRYE